MSTIDHYVISGSDLAGLVTWFADTTGVEPSPGGSHTGVGTRNALVSLGPVTYIELIAPDPEQDEPANPRPFGIDGLGPDDHPLAGFAAGVTDLDAVVDRLRGVGVDIGVVRAMSRRRPDGVELSWRLTQGGAGGSGAMPFLIEWGDTPHPAASAATGCTIATTGLRHPDPASLTAAVEAIGLDIAVHPGPESIELAIDTPRGTIPLG